MDAPADIVACGPAERGEQAELFNRCFKKRIDAEALRWRYDANPAGAATSLLLRQEGEGVSGYACSPRFVVPNGNEEWMATVGQTGDVMTDPGWRGKGLFSRLDRACMAATAERGWPVVFGLPNHRSAHIFLELGWERVGAIRPFSFVLKSDESARAARSRDGRLAAWATPLSARSCKRAREQWEPTASACQVRPLADGFPAEVASLSSEIEGRFSFMVRRSSEYLNWRFIQGPSDLHRSIGLFGEGGRLKGYVVVQLPREDTREGYLVDVLTEDDATLARAISVGLDALEEAGASLVTSTAVEGSWWGEKLRMAGFLPSRPERAMMIIAYVHAPDHPVAAAARDPSRWYLTDGDRDDETM